LGLGLGLGWGWEHGINKNKKSLMQALVLDPSESLSKNMGHLRLVSHYLKRSSDGSTSFPTFKFNLMYLIKWELRRLLNMYCRFCDNLKKKNHFSKSDKINGINYSMNSAASNNDKGN
jgi:hypothetical protein